MQGLLGSLLLAQAGAMAPDPGWVIEDVAVPEAAVLEVGGIASIDSDTLAVCTRRGELWIVRDAFGDEPVFTLALDGLHEPLGLLVVDDWIYTVQRGELSRMRDVDGDDRIDLLETVCDDWEISGNYHEYAFGPRRDANGDFWVTLNKPFGEEPFGNANWRGWAVRITPEGVMDGASAGLRSPAGIESSPDGDIFYTDNQGDWCGASKLSHLEVGEFHGHPHGIASCELEASSVKHPGDVPDGMPMPEVGEVIEHFKLPAVWFPYDKMGRSPSGMVWDTTGGGFGPFAGQVFVGDQYAPIVMRVDLEEVDGHWQGACFPFLEGFACGITRLAWVESDEPTLVVGMTDRGWPSLGSRGNGLQHVRFGGTAPFAVRTMRARPEGFRLEFTDPFDPETLGEPGDWGMSSYTYVLHSPYGSPETNTEELEVVAIRPGADGRTLDLVVEGLREGYVHELHLPEVRDQGGRGLDHSRAYYTLINRPEAETAP